MPLSKRRKAEYDRLRRLSSLPNSLPSTPSSLPRLQNSLPKLDEIQGLINSIHQKHKQTEAPLDLPPFYDPNFHRPGDTVRVRRGKRVLTTVIPELDAEGNTIPGGADV